MILRPKKTKFRKFFKGKNKGNASKGTRLIFGKYGLMALENGRITENQIESSRKIINNSLKRLGKLWIKIFPNIPVSKKPIENRMGKGKGDISHFICRVKPGKILFELDNIKYNKAMSSLNKSSSKLPIKTKIVSIFDNYI